MALLRIATNGVYRLEFAFADDCERTEFMELRGGLLCADGWLLEPTAAGGGDSTATYTRKRDADYGVHEAIHTVENRCRLVYDSGSGADNDLRYGIPPATLPTEPVDAAARLYAQRDGGCVDFALLSATGTEFKVHVHKCVLSIRSEVFQRAFDNGDLSEHCIDLKEGKLPLPQADDKAVDAFIKAVYTGKYELEYTKEPESVLALLHLSDMYLLDDIKAHIEWDLMQSASVDNGYAMAALADKYALTKLHKMIFAALPAGRK